MQKRRQREGAEARRVRQDRETREKRQQEDKAIFQHVHEHLDKFEEKERAKAEANKKG